MRVKLLCSEMYKNSAMFLCQTFWLFFLLLFLDIGWPKCSFRIMIGPSSVTEYPPISFFFFVYGSTKVVIESGVEGEGLSLTSFHYQACYTGSQTDCHTKLELSSSVVFSRVRPLLYLSHFFFFKFCSWLFSPGLASQFQMFIFSSTVSSRFGERKFRIQV